MSRVLESDDLQQAYRAVVHDLLLRRTRIGYVLVLVLVPIGGVLDYFIYDQSGLFWPIFYVRLICTAVLVPSFVWTLSASGSRYIRILNSALVLAPVFAMCWMIYLTDGAVSSYYAGMNLMIVGTCLLAPYTGRGAAAYCAIVIVSYTAACLLHHKTLLVPSILMNNLFFIILTSIICVTARHYSTVRHMEDFRLRHELDTRNKELDHSYRRLTEMDRLKSQFFANLNHELRTPLTLILSPIEMLLHRQPPLPERVGHTLLLVKNNGLRLLKLINDMLEVLRLEEGRLALDKKPVNLATFVPGIVDSIRQLAAEKKIDMRSEGLSEPLMISGDPPRLEKVMLNLLTNAIKFTPAGGEIISRWSQDGSTARVEVQDTGIGIPDHELPHVFDRFRQADGSSTRKYQGVGLGLALSKELIEEHDGQLSVHSQEGVGTTFVIEMAVDDTIVAESESEQVSQASITEDDPFAVTFSAADRLGSLARSRQQKEATEVGQGPLRVLVVDDEPDIRNFLVSVLSEEYRVLQAADGASGLELARQKQPDLVLLDLMLPVMDGLDVCRTLKRHQETSDIKIVLLTARVDEGSKIEALERGADDFLTKPFSTVEVKTRIRNLLRTAFLQKDLRQQNQRLEEALNRLKATEAQLIQSEKINALGSLSAGLLHEINNPLNFAMTAVQLLQQTADRADEDLQDTLQDIDQGMQRIRDIVSDLRAFAYPQHEVGQERFDVCDALKTAMRFTAHLHNGHHIEEDLAPRSQVVGSKSHISQVLVNLLTNAIYAVESVRDRRTPQIRVSSRRNENKLSIQVWDNGQGVKPEDLSRVFDPFFTTKEVGQGMGLGLSICHTIVHNHRGTIRISSDQERGTHVTFELPLADSES